MPDRTCKKCGVTRPLTEFYRDTQCAGGRKAVCKPCKRAYQRPYQAEWSRRPGSPEIVRKQVRKWQGRNPEKKRAHRKVEYALKTGALVRPDACEDCGQIPDQALHGHHEDYSKPLAVEWLCSACHGKRHCGDYGPRGGSGDG